MKPARGVRQAPHGALASVDLNAVAVAVVLAGAAASVLIFMALQHAERQRLATRLATHAAERGEAFRGDLANLVDLTGAVQALHAASEHVTAAEFELFTAPLLARHPEVEAFEWAERVPGASRAEFEAARRQAGAPDFVIREIGPQGNLRVAEERDEYWPVVRIQPRIGNEGVLGLDLASESRRREAVLSAARDGQPASTAPIRLVQDPSSGWAVLLVVPDVRSGAVNGVAVAVLRCQEVLELTLASFPDALEVHLLDVSGPEPVVLASSWRPQAGAPPDVASSIEAARERGSLVETPLTFAGREWRLATVGSPAFMAAGRTWTPQVALVGGLLLSALIGLIFIIIGRQSALLEQLASTDALTGLLNRRGLEKALERLRREPPVAAILINCDDLNHLNKSHGHGVGDVVLAELARRLAEAVTPPMAVGRIGGDEFAILAPMPDDGAALALSDRLRRRLAADPVIAVPRTLHVTASAGVAMVPEHPCSLMQVLAEARIALRASKVAGKNRSSVAGHITLTSGPATADAFIARLKQRDTLRVHWEPLVRLADGVTTGHELLIRGPAGEFESPDEIFRTATERGVLTQVDMLCLRACIRSAAERREGGQLHLNLLPSTLVDLPVSAILRELEALPAGYETCIEVNEQQFLSHPAYLLEPVSALRQAGLRIAMDDVGSGHGTLDSVLVLQPDIVKLDMSLVRGASSSPERGERLTRLVRLCHALAIQMVAEGVESPAERKFLERLGVQWAQGFLWPGTSASADGPAETAQPGA